MDDSNESNAPSRSIIKNLNSSVGQKYIMAASGIGLVVFMIMHLAGNLTLLDSSGQAFNLYAKNLHDFGYLAIVGEIGIAAIFLLHIFMAFRLTFNYRAARPEGYAILRSKGGPSKSTVGSRNMIITGFVLFVFLIYHIWQFRFGPSLEQGYIVDIRGEPARDLFRLVAETFANPLHVVIYVGTMVFLGFHLRHGFWSMFQSLGAMYPRWSPCIYLSALLVAISLAVGFIILPIWLFAQAGG